MNTTRHYNVEITTGHAFTAGEVQQALLEYASTHKDEGPAVEVTMTTIVESTSEEIIEEIQ